MTPLFATRRAAEEFASVIEGSRSDGADRYRPLLRTVTLLRERPTVEPRAEFVSDLRTQLMTAADTMLAPVTTRQPPRPRRSRRLSTAIAASLVVVGASGGVAVAAQGSLPGETLYPIKRSLESAQVYLNPSDTGKAAGMLGQAGTRLDEVGELARDGRSTDAIGRTLEDFQKSANQGADLLFAAYQRDGNAADIARVHDFAASNMSQLDDIAAVAPASMQDAFAKAANVLAAIDAQARTLCISCAGQTVSMPGSLSLASSLGALTTLLIQPAHQADQAVAAAHHQAELAAAAEDAMKTAQGQVAPQPPPPAASTTQDLASDGAPTTQAPSGPDLKTLKETVGSATGGVNQLLAVLSGVTAPVTNTLDTVLGPLPPRN